MSASLAIGTSYTDTSGVITLDITGGSPYPLLPASTITGFTATVATIPAPISTVTSFQDQVIITLVTPPTAGQAIAVSYTAIAGNLTDSNATPNTMPDQTSISVVNNVGSSTITTTTTTTGVSLIGQWTANGTIGGHTSIISTGLGGLASFRFVGTQAILLWYYATTLTDISISIDGGAFTTPNLPLTTYRQNLVLCTGLADTTHTVDIRCGTSGNHVNLSTAANQFVSITGSSPSITFPSFVDAAGTQKVAASDTTHLVNEYNASGTAGWLSTTSQGYTPVYNSNVQSTGGTGAGGFSDASIHFQATIATLSIFVLAAGQSLRLRVDGAYSAPVVMPNTSKWTVVQLASGLDATTQHDYAITEGASTGGLIWYSIMTTGGTGINTSVAPPARSKTILFYGDSITCGIVGTANDSGLAFGYQIACNKLWGEANRGSGGCTVHHFASGTAPFTTLAMETRTTDVTNINPDYLVILGGTNDFNQNGGAETSAQFQASYAAMLAAIVAVCTTTRIFCLAITPRTSATPNNLAVWNNVIPNAIATLTTAQKSLITYVDWTTGTSPVICRYNTATSDYTDPNGDTSDGLHPTQSGYTKMITALTPFLNASASLNVYQAYTDTAGSNVILNVGAISTYPLSPTSAITGFTVNVNGSPATISTATSANGLVTLALASPVTSGQTVTFSYSIITGNLTDSAGTPNPMGTIVNQSVANNASATATTFANSSTFVITADGTTTGTNAGHSYLLLPNECWEIDFQFTGTQVAMLCAVLAANNNIIVSIDGGPQNTVPTLGTPWNSWVLASGLTDSLHTCKIKGVSLNTIHIDVNNFITVTGSAPAVSQWAQYAGLVQSINTSPNSSAVLFDSNIVVSTIPHSWNSIGNNFSAPEMNGHVAFQFEGTGIYIRLNAGSVMGVSIDGGPQIISPSLNTTPNTDWSWYPIATNLSPGLHTVTMDIGLQAPSGQYGGANFMWGQIMTFGGAGLNTGYVPVTRNKRWAAYGDSITENRNPSVVQGWAFLTPFNFNWQNFNRGWGGSLVSGAASSSGQIRFSQVTSISPLPNIIYVEYGTNDAASAIAHDVFLAAYIVMLQGLIAGCPNAQIICQSPIPDSRVADSTTAAFGYLIRNAVAIINNPLVTFFDSAPWLMAFGTRNFTPYYLDGTHPNVPGNLRMNTFQQGKLTPRRRNNGNRTGIRNAA